MYPVCIPAAGLRLVGGAISTGGLIALIVKELPARTGATLEKE